MKPVLEMSTEEVERFFGVGQFGGEIFELRTRDAEIQALRGVVGENPVLQFLLKRLEADRKKAIMEYALNVRHVARTLRDFTAHLRPEHDFVEIEPSLHGFQRAVSSSSILSGPKEAYHCKNGCGWVKGKPVREAEGFGTEAVFLCLMCGRQVGSWQSNRTERILAMWAYAAPARTSCGA